MWDFLTALLGGKHCGWCTAKPNGWLMEHYNGTGPRDQQPPLRRAFWILMDINDRLGIWKLGRAWHFRVHESRKGQATWR